MVKKVTRYIQIMEIPESLGFTFLIDAMSGAKGLLFGWWSYWKFGDIREQFFSRAVATHVRIWLV